MSKSADAIATREQVYQQMLAKFPASAIGWVREVRWSGPLQISTDRINSEGKEKWAASHDPHKVESDRQKIDANTARPAVLVRGPNGKIDIVDGHHRYLAAEAEGKPLTAWLAEVPRDTGPWTETHSAQIGGPSN